MASRVLEEFVHLASYLCPFEISDGTEIVDKLCLRIRTSIEPLDYRSSILHEMLGRSLVGWVRVGVARCCNQKMGPTWIPWTEHAGCLPPCSP